MTTRASVDGISNLYTLPLLAKENPVQLDADLVSKDLTNCALFFGTGLCTTKEMSQGLPVDFFGLIATAEKVRDILGFGRIIHLIADSHAKSNHFVSDVEVDQRACELRQQLLLATQRLGIDNVYEIKLASEFDSTQEYVEILQQIPSEAGHEYVRREWADMEYLARHDSVCLKLSWKMPLRTNQKHKSDEVFFDQGFKETFNRPYSFVYNAAAVTFDPSRLNVCPYTSATGEKRILIQPNEDAEQKLQQFSKTTKQTQKAVARATESLIATMGLFETTFNVSLPEGSLGTKINAAIKIFLQ